MFEWDDFDPVKTLIQPRPFEVSSSAAIDFKYKNRVLQYLIVRQKHWYDAELPVQNEINREQALSKPNEGKEKGYKFTLYSKNQTWHLVQVSQKEAAQGVVREGVVSKEGEKAYVKLGKNFYEFVEIEAHDLDTVPAFRVGCYRDLATNGHTFVNPIHCLLYTSPSPRD